MSQPRSGKLSPVSSYCMGTLDGDELDNFESIRVRNRELREQLGLKGAASEAVPAISAQVEDHLAQLRYAVAANTKLRADIDELQAECAGQGQANAGALWTGQDVSPSGNSFYNSMMASSPGGSRYTTESQVEHERQAAILMEEIQGVTSSNIELISQCDEEVKRLETEILIERRRRQAAEVEALANPNWPGTSPVRSASPVRSTTLTPTSGTFTEAEELARQRAELQELESECAALARESLELQAERSRMEERTVQELQMAQEVQVEELEHFRRLVAEKQRGASGGPTASRSDASPGTSPPNSNILLQAELEQLREHLAMVQRKGEQDQLAAEAATDELRKESRELEQRLADAATQKAQCLKDVAEAQHGGSQAVADGSRCFETEHDRGEELLKEIARTRTRLEGLDAEKTQLEQEKKDISERASHIQQAVPHQPGEQDEPLASASAANLQAAIVERQRQLDDARREEDSLRHEAAKIEEELDAAKVEASVMEQKMKLLKSRISQTEG